MSDTISDEQSELEDKLLNSKFANTLKSAYTDGLVPLGEYFHETYADYRHEARKASGHIRQEGLMDYFAYKKEVKFRAKRLRHLKLREFREQVASHLRETTGFNDWIVEKLSQIPEPYVEGRFAKTGKLARNISMGAAFSATGIHGLPEEYLDALCLTLGADPKFQKIAALGIDFALGTAGILAAKQFDLSTESIPGILTWGYLALNAVQPIVRSGYYLRTKGHHMRSLVAFVSPNYAVMTTQWAVTGHQLLRRYNHLKNPPEKMI